MQNIFLKIWEKRERLDNIKNINNYLYTMTKNSCLDLIKHKKVKNTFSKNYLEEKLSIQQQFLNDQTASLIIENELEKKITEGINLLPEKCRKVFIKSRIEGLKHVEIAKSLEISKRTVDNHISNGLRHMRVHLKEFLTLFL